jgi:hypothetical protein
VEEAKEPPLETVEEEEPNMNGHEIIDCDKGDESIEDKKDLD